MNSDEEKQLLESCGWEYDYVKRIWTAPDGYEITTDQLMEAMDEMGQNVEYALRAIAMQHGKLT